MCGIFLKQGYHQTRPGHKCVRPAYKSVMFTPRLALKTSIAIVPFETVYISIPGIGRRPSHSKPNSNMNARRAVHSQRSLHSVPETGVVVRGSPASSA